MNRDKLIETCLSALRSLYSHKATPVELLQDGKNILELLVRLAGPESSVTTQACVASLLNANCRNHNGQVVIDIVLDYFFIIRIIYFIFILWHLLSKLIKQHIFLLF